MNDLSGNKGEWSEIYTFFKLLADGKLYGADSELNKKDDIFYDILKIIRNENVGTLHFVFNGNSHTVDVRNEAGTTQVTLSTDRFSEEAEALYHEICQAGTSSFRVVRASRFLDDLLCQKLKAPSADKSDITIKVHDFNTGMSPILGFSIKSRIGKPSTLLNAGRNSNFVFEIIGDITDQNMEEINNAFIPKTRPDGTVKMEISVAQRINYIKDHGYTLSYHKMAGATFQNNLIMIDSDLPEITAYMMLEYYLSGTTNICDAIESVKEKNPLGYDLCEGHLYYSYKFKKLVTESALGMLPGKVWTGRADANGGYIIVREDGEVLCYHLFNRNDFEDYLLKNTRFDRGGAGRHEFAVVEKENGRYYIKLNLQIRFIR